MLWTIAVVLIVLWVFGYFSMHFTIAVIHVLLLVALVLLLVALVLLVYNAVTRSRSGA